MIPNIPAHLQRYCVDQDYSRYTPVNQSAWRYILRQLRAYLEKYAHPDYLQGLEKTGISVDRIPSIAEISERLEEFGWKAVPVSGFIPPAAFMEMQAHGILPIASDMRSVDHLLYTPAPDIVHEAAGHAPFLATPEYAEYLKRYAQVAKKAIISHEDISQYEAIRVLSDLKESPEATDAQIEKAEQDLLDVNSKMSHTSEATLLGRMNWWTAEYGLIGDIESPKIYGAGLLSSVGESRECLKPKVRKIPLTAECVEQSYDITEQQPQLYVTPDFAHLNKVLDDFADTMAFKIGGTEGLQRAIKAKSVCSVQFGSGLQCSGLVDFFLVDDQGEPAYIKLSGECQLCFRDQELTGHGRHYHKEGFGTPVGPLKAFPDECPSELTHEQLQSLGWTLGAPIELEYSSGLTITGKLQSFLNLEQKNLVVTLSQAKAQFKDQTLFKPEWGLLDIALGSKITSVFGGPADRSSYGEYEDFKATQIPRRTYSARELLRHSLYDRSRELRENNVNGTALAKAINELFVEIEKEFPKEWLLLLELYELSFRFDEGHPLAQTLLKKLEALAHNFENISAPIHDGLFLASHE